MQLYLLRKRDNLPVDDDPWNPWYDKAEGFVVRANSETEARQIAQDNGGDEVKIPAWTDKRYSTCKPITHKGEPGLILMDFHAA